MSTSRILPEAGFVEEKTLPRGPNGRALCRRCGNEVARPRMTFCGPECVHEWKLRTQPGYARQCVFTRDRGICAICRHDCGGTQRVPNGKVRGGAFDVDHVVPVIEGGGSCGIDNFRTLCRPCHKRVTAELARRRAEQRRAEKTNRQRAERGDGE